MKQKVWSQTKMTTKSCKIILKIQDTITTGWDKISKKTQRDTKQPKNKKRDKISPEKQWSEKPEKYYFKDNKKHLKIQKHIKSKWDEMSSMSKTQKGITHPCGMQPSTTHLWSLVITSQTKLTQSARGPADSQINRHLPEHTKLCLWYFFPGPHFS